MKFSQRWAFLSILLVAAPVVLYGGVLDWLGIGKVAEVAGNVTMAFVLKDFLDNYMPLIAVLLLSGLGVACFRGSQMSMQTFLDVYREANKDDRISWGEKILLVATYLPTIATVAALLYFGGVLIYAGGGGLLTLATTKPMG